MCHKLCYIAKTKTKVYVNVPKCQKLECASCLARKFDPRQLEQLQLKQTPLIHYKYVLIEIVINQKNVAIGLRVTSTQNPLEECGECRICTLVWNRALFGRDAAWNIFIQAQCQILHYICRKRQLLGWLSCEWRSWVSVNVGFRSEISDQVAAQTLSLSGHHQLLHTEAESQTRNSETLDEKDYFM